MIDAASVTLRIRTPDLPDSRSIIPRDLPGSVRLIRAAAQDDAAGVVRRGLVYLVHGGENGHPVAAGLDGDVVGVAGHRGDAVAATLDWFEVAEPPVVPNFVVSL